MTLQSLGSNTMGGIASKHHDAISKTLELIASGKKSALDDAASSSISDMLQSQVSALNAGVMNGHDAIGMLQIADGALSSLSKDAQELSRLSVSYNNAALSDQQKSSLLSQAQDIKGSMEQTVQSATMNGESVFGSKSFELGSGAHTFSMNEPHISSLDIRDTKTLENFTKELNANRSEAGSSINAIASTLTSNISAATNLQRSKSQLSDVDVAQAMNEKTKNEVQMNVAILTQAHAVDYLQKMSASLLR